MSKPIKDMLTRELTERYAALDSALLVEGGIALGQLARQHVLDRLAHEVMPP
jgi:hypothetical protein